MPTARPNRALLEVRDLTISYTQTRVSAPVVDSLSFDLGPGEVLGVQGASGCGKTSVALALLKLLPASASVTGSVRFLNKDLLCMDERELRRVRGERISIIYQEPALALNPVLRVGDQIAEVLRAHKSLSARDRKQQVQELLDVVGLHAPRFYRAYPHELSGGECHRILLAQALICRPSLVIADEPTAGLDARVKSQILDLIGGIRKKFGTAFLLISHDRNVIEKLADRRLLVGGDREHYTPTAMRPTAKTESPRAIDAQPSAHPGPLIQVRALSKRYSSRNMFRTSAPETQALDDANLTIESASVCALIGASGSGKSTLAKCLALLEYVDSGEIWFAGEQISPSPTQSAQQFRRRIQLVHQDPASALNPRFSAAEAIEEPLVIEGVRSKIDRRDQALTFMKEVGLDSSSADRSCHEFSGGQKQRIAIARALTLNPKLLIFDESLSGLDPETRGQLLELILRLKNILGISILLISHDLEQVANVADFVAVMHRGRIVEHRRTAALFRDPKHSATLDLLNVPTQKSRVAAGGAQ
jgi:peptide/nickel transport system ATP-binding protein